MRFQELTGGDITVSGENPSRTRRWRALDIGFTPGVDAFDLVASSAIGFVPRQTQHPQGQLFRGDIQLHENTYARDYEISCTYTKEEREAGAYQITVGGTGGTVNVKAGTRIAGFGPEADKVDNGGLIGVNGDEIEGVDIPVSGMLLSVSYRHPQGKLNRNYIKAIDKLVGYVNNDIFLGYDPGEVRFLKPSFTESNTEASAGYDFEISRNQVNEDVGGIVVTSRKGWDVLAISYKDDVLNGVPVKKVKYIETIRPAGRAFVDFVPAFGWGG